MNVTREVILDLFPVYLSGEASPATKALVEEFLQQDPELARRLRAQCVENFDAAIPSPVPPDLELRSLRRTRGLTRLQSWLMGLGIGLALTSLSCEFQLDGWRVTEFHFLIRDNPALLGAMLGLSALCWIAYFALQRRLRTF